MVKSRLLQTFAVLVGAAHLLFSLESVACNVYRSVRFCKGANCDALAIADFEKYAQSTLDCGVHKEAVPYVTRAHGSTTKGTVVLVHGLSANPAHVKHISEYLADEGYNVVAPILHGHGGKDADLARGALDEWKADLKFAGAIGQRLKGPLYIMGHSTGGVMAGLEASLRPSQYKAFVGLDPAMNTDGDDGWKLQKACVAKNFWTFPSDVPQALGGPESDCPPDETAHSHEVKKRVREIDDIVKKYCGQGVKTPPLNYEFALRALCSLSRAATEMTPERIKKLPPALTILSKDDATFSYIAKDKLEADMTAKPENKLVSSDATMHGLMTTFCSESFNKDMAQVKAWLKKHK